jgi:hypothetical protein
MTHCYAYILLEYPKHFSWYYVRILHCPYQHARFRLERSDSILDGLYDGWRSARSSRFGLFRQRLDMMQEEHGRRHRFRLFDSSGKCTLEGRGISDNVKAVHLISNVWAELTCTTLYPSSSARYRIVLLLPEPLAPFSRTERYISLLMQADKRSRSLALAAENGVGGGSISVSLW